MLHVANSGGKMLKMSRDGASPPPPDPQETFGFTVDNVLKIAREMFGK